MYRVVLSYSVPTKCSKTLLNSGIVLIKDLNTEPHMIGALMLDIAGTTLTLEDIELLKAPQVGGMILFSRNIESPEQVRTLTDHMRLIRPDILIAVDQEGGRVQRLKTGFTCYLPWAVLVKSISRIQKLLWTSQKNVAGLWQLKFLL